eukprot:GHVN01069434.1.p1 GENE.GHVN01069434.1~~GHVN01069434.1.p1  ORF type:complete len:1113 (+),score=189.76 GHVN01069434.1:541-3879(+)
MGTSCNVTYSFVLFVWGTAFCYGTADLGHLIAETSYASKSRQYHSLRYSKDDQDIRNLRGSGGVPLSRGRWKKRRFVVAYDVDKNGQVSRGANPNGLLGRFLARRNGSRYLPTLQMEIFEFAGVRRDKKSGRLSVLESYSGDDPEEEEEEEQEGLLKEVVAEIKRERGVSFVDSDSQIEFFQPLHPPSPVNGTTPQLEDEATQQSKMPNMKQFVSAAFRELSGWDMFGDSHNMSAAERDDPGFDKQWYLHDSTADEQRFDLEMLDAWAMYQPVYPDRNVTIAVIDSGADLSHPDMKHAYWINPNEIPGNGIDDDLNGYVDDVYGYDFRDDDGNPSDDDGHGTHLAGIIAATPNNKRGVSGVCPNCKVMSLKFMDSTGFGLWGDAIEAIEYSLSMGVMITVNSYGSYSQHEGLKEAITRAGKKGMLFIAASGNDGNDNDRRPKIPASFGLGNVISVASINRMGNLSWFSNYGAATTDIAAPGEAIYSTGPQGSYKWDQGTSQAAPAVAAIAAMVWASNPLQSYKQVKKTIMKSVRPVPGLQVIAKGTISAKRALEETKKAMVNVQDNVNNRCEVRDPCHWHASCEDLESDVRCVCHDGFTGDGWDECLDTDECSSTPSRCAAHSKCTNLPGSYKCECESGYVGDGVSSCQPFSLCPLFNPCHADAHCFGAGGLGIPKCVCREGYQGDGINKCDDLDECLTNKGGCHHYCENTKGSYRCSCQEGFLLGPDGHSCTDINECKEGNGGCSQICVNQPGRYSCFCEEGFETSKTDPTKCDDVDECLSDNGGCGQICTNTIGGRDCSCGEGFYQDPNNSDNCRDVNECIGEVVGGDRGSGTANGGCEQLCNNLPGGFDCGCFDGFQLEDNQVSCTDIDECSISNGGCSHTCENHVGSYKCLCPEGYYLNQKDERECLDVDECRVPSLRDTCEHLCVNTAGSFECKCEGGFKLKDDKRGCAEINECLVENGGCDHSCRNLVGSHECECFEGYKLYTDDRRCLELECDGPQLSSIPNARSACPIGFAGKDRVCDVRCREGFHLKSNTLKCLPDGTWGGAAICDCPDGYQLGFNDEECIDIDECLVNNGGCDDDICVNWPGSYECTCGVGYRYYGDECRGE